MDKFSDFLGKVAFKVDQNKYLTAIKQTFTIYMPFVIIGSFSTLFNVLLSSPTTGLASFDIFSWLENLTPAFNAMSFSTLDIMSLAIPVILGAQLGRSNKVNTITSGIVELVAYISIDPHEIEVIIDGAKEVVSGLPVTATNSSGLFVGMIVAILSVELFSKLVSMESLKIKMPDTVPTGITD